MHNAVYYFSFRYDIHHFILIYCDNLKYFYTLRNVLDIRSLAMYHIYTLRICIKP